jgi:ribosomal protein S12 methylthiotransferase
MISLGCAKNRVDSEQALGVLQSMGYAFVQKPEEAGILIVNTCGFIASAKQESIDAILEMAAYKQTGVCYLLVVTGCLAQRYEKELLNQIPEIDVLLGVSRYDRLAEAITQALAGKRVADCRLSLSFFEQPRVLTTPAYACYHRISDGCDNRCAYCAIPLIRGSYRSRGRRDILNEIAEMAARGVKEHTLVAQDTTRYGADLGKPGALRELLAEAAAVPGVEWLRLLYCYPDETDDQLLDVMAGTPAVCKYLDLPIQHISARLLRRMNRRGSPDTIRRLLSRARGMGFALRSTVIVGFPGETEDDFRLLMDFIRETAFDRLGAFAFSREEGTPAGRMRGQVPEAIKQERLDTLMSAQSAISRDRNRLRIRQTYRVLVTGAISGGRYIGRSEFEAPESDGVIGFSSKIPLSPGDFCFVRITKAGNYDLEGVAV